MAPKGKKAEEAAAKGGKAKRAKEAPAEEPEEVDYATSGPDVAKHKRISNYIYWFVLFAFLTVIVVHVFMGVSGGASGKHGTKPTNDKGR